MSSSDGDTVRDLVLSNAFLRVFPDELLARLEKASVRRRYAESDKVIRRGEPPHALYCVAKGQLKVLGIGGRGREFVLTYLGPGQWFGEMSIFDNLPRTHDVVAKVESEILVVPRQELLAIFDENPKLYRHFAELLCRKLRLLFAVIEDTGLLGLGGRLAKRLLGVADEHGEITRDGIAIKLHLPHEELARLLGASREAISRHLKSWEQSGWVDLGYGRIVIKDRPALEQLIADSEQGP
ncbi:MAG TPA: Crp/Fnr family transcriptional regulator [Terriglobales bacterium]|nr:Crp/Fnr family transcriptional regulator [Terriglobales bacterium]